jgi:hypothetical protein
MTVIHYRVNIWRSFNLAISGDDHMKIKRLVALCTILTLLVVFSASRSEAQECCYFNPLAIPFIAAAGLVGAAAAVTTGLVGWPYYYGDYYAPRYYGSGYYVPRYYGSGYYVPRYYGSGYYGTRYYRSGYYGPRHYRSGYYGSSRYYKGGYHRGSYYTGRSYRGGGGYRGYPAQRQ